MKSSLLGLKMIKNPRSHRSISDQKMKVYFSEQKWLKMDPRGQKTLESSLFRPKSQNLGPYGRNRFFVKNYMFHFSTRNDKKICPVDQKSIFNQKMENRNFQKKIIKNGPKSPEIDFWSKIKSSLFQIKMTKNRP